MEEKKVIVSINLGNFGSTGSIMRGIGKLAAEYGYKYFCVYPGNTANKPKQDQDIIICKWIHKKLIEKLSYYTGYRGFWMFFNTWLVLKKVKKINPSIVHLHNLHDSYINLPMLFEYLKESNCKVVWTLHDCWSFTGQCPYFTIEKCEKWKTGCHHCPQLNVYPASCVDRTKTMWKLKKKWFTNIRNMTLVTPSQWLAELVKKSYLKDYNVKVINNGIDLEVFKPTESNFREIHGIGENINIVLGVAFGWGIRKGLDTFIELSKRLDSKLYQIVLVGTNDRIDKQLPSSIISIHRTHDQIKLAEIYTSADLFVNPTREENYPTVNMESIACGTPVLTYRTGGSPEILDETCGAVVDCDDIDTLESEIIRILNEKPYSKEACLKRAESFNQLLKYQEYFQLYETK